MQGKNKKSIIAKNLAKQYVIGGREQQYDSFREYFANLVLSPFRKYKVLKGDDNENLFWALQDINFEIEQGEIVGVIGHNGAGKSTLLKVLSRITMPTKGEVQINGRVASLLEVGTGFHPELTGRENIYLNGSILGMSRKQINKSFDEIVAFAEVEKFLDTPVKRYSSGMYVRLAFAVAANLDSDVLLVDEVLAVGDHAFQKRCFGKLGEVSGKGRTVIFVSHNLSAISKLCPKVIVLEKGKVVFNGDVNEGISVYNNQSSNVDVLSKQDYRGDLYPQVEFEEFEINGQRLKEGVEINPEEPLEICIKGLCQRPIDEYRTVLNIRKDGQLLFSLYDTEQPDLLEQRDFYSIFKIPEYILVPGEYTFSIGGIAHSQNQWLTTRDYRFVVGYRWAKNYDTTCLNMGIINLNVFGKRRVT